MMDSITTLLSEEARRIWCYRWLAVAVAAVTFAAGAVYVERLPDVYEAWGQIFVNRQTPVSVAAQGVSLVGDGYGSPYVVEKTLLNDQNLETVVRRRNPAAAGFDTAAMAGAVARLRGKIHVSDQGDGFVEFRYSDTDAVKARDTVQLLLDQFIDQNIKRSQKDLGEAQDFLDDQIAAYGRMLADEEAQLGQLERQYPVLSEGISPPPPAPALAAKGEPPAIRAAPSPPPARPPAKTSPAQELVASLEAKLASLRTVYTDQYPDVVAVRRQLAEAKAKRDQEANLGSDAAESTSQAPAAEPDPAPSAGARRGARVDRLPAAPAAIAARWSDLRRNREILRADYQQLLSHRAATRMSEAVYATDKSSKYQVTHRPTLPLGPSGPKRGLYLAVAALGAVAAGLGAAYLTAGLKGILVAPREVEQAFQLPVVGTVAWERAWQAPRRSRATGIGTRRSRKRRRAA